MKKQKKIGLVLGLFMALAIVTFGPIFAKSARAESIDKDSFTKGLYIITATENGRPKTISATIAGLNAIFSDSNTSDSDINLKTADKVGFICPQGNKDMGITLDAGSKRQVSGIIYYSGTITVNYSPDSSKDECDSTGHKLAFKVPITARGLKPLTITAPKNGDSVEGTLVGATALVKDGIGVSEVTFKLNGAKTLGTERVKFRSGNYPGYSIYHITWDSTKVKNGSQTLAATGVIPDKPNDPTDQIKITVNNTNSTALVTNDASCESSSHIGLEWIVCPLLRGIDGVVTSFYGEVNNQLCFPAGDSTTAGGVECGKSILTPQIHQAWSLIKNIATVLLVIVMLVAVISEALGAGPFDAYAIRKILPKLVVAAILMQLSWILAKWAIDITNDVGRGLQALMFAPFGPNVNSIDHALGSIGASGVTVGAGLFAGIAAVVAFSGLTVFGIGIMALTGLAALFVGFMVLIFRKLLIILSIIVLPVALVLWILPGTERYWKMWQENFTKLLLMFPMIVALIAAGRIFGTVASNATSGPVALFTVLVGFFGPLLLLPKTYQWGGAALSAMSGAMVNGTKGLRRKPMEYAMGRAQENRQRRSQLRAERLADDPNNRRFRDRLLAGEFNYARQRGRGGRLGAREMSFAQTLSEGEKTARENVPAQLLRSGYDSWRHGPATNENGERIFEGEAGYEINKLDALQAWLEGRTYAGVAPSAALSGHAFDTLATLGDPDRLREARTSGHVDPDVWQKAVARNFPKVNEIARYLTLAPDLTNLTPRQLSTQDDDTARELERQLRGNYVHNRETGGSDKVEDPAEQRDRLTRAVTLGAEARNPLVWSELSQAKRGVIENIENMARESGIDVDAIQEAAGVPRRARNNPQAPQNPQAPAPPEGPGPEDNEDEIRIDN